MPAEATFGKTYDSHSQENENRNSDSNSSSSLGKQATHALAAWQRFFGHSPHDANQPSAKALEGSRHKHVSQDRLSQSLSQALENGMAASPAREHAGEQAEIFKDGKPALTSKQPRDSLHSKTDGQSQTETRPGTTQHNGIEHHLMKLAPLEEQAELVRHSPATTASTPTSPGKAISMVRPIGSIHICTLHGAASLPHVDHKEVCIPCQLPFKLPAQFSMRESFKSARGG